MDNTMGGNSEPQGVILTFFLLSRTKGLVAWTTLYVDGTGEPPGLLTSVPYQGIGGNIDNTIGGSGEAQGPTHPLLPSLPY
jgi:hypothetical protein